MIFSSFILGLGLALHVVPTPTYCATASAIARPTAGLWSGPSGLESGRVEEMCRAAGMWQDNPAIYLPGLAFGLKVRGTLPNSRGEAIAKSLPANV